MFKDSIEARVRRLRQSTPFSELHVDIPTSVLDNAAEVCAAEQCTMQSFVTEALDFMVEAFRESSAG